MYSRRIECDKEALQEQLNLAKKFITCSNDDAMTKGEIAWGRMGKGQCQAHAHS